MYKALFFFFFLNFIAWGESSATNMIVSDDVHKLTVQSLLTLWIVSKSSPISISDRSILISGATRKKNQNTISKAGRGSWSSSLTRDLLHHTTGSHWAPFSFFWLIGIFSLRAKHSCRYANLWIWIGYWLCRAQVNLLRKEYTHQQGWLRSSLLRVVDALVALTSWVFLCSLVFHSVSLKKKKGVEPGQICIKKERAKRGYLILIVGLLLLRFKCNVNTLQLIGSPLLRKPNPLCFLVLELLYCLQVVGVSA